MRRILGWDRAGFSNYRGTLRRSFAARKSIKTEKSANEEFHWTPPARHEALIEFRRGPRCPPLDGLIRAKLVGQFPFTRTANVNDSSGDWKDTDVIQWIRILHVYVHTAYLRIEWTEQAISSSRPRSARPKFDGTYLLACLYMFIYQHWRFSAIECFVKQRE